MFVKTRSMQIKVYPINGTSRFKFFSTNLIKSKSDFSLGSLRELNDKFNNESMP